MRYLLYICAGLLLIAIAELSYDYYTFLRLVVTIGAVLVVYNEYSRQLNFWVISFGIIAFYLILFFPYISEIENFGLLLMYYVPLSLL